jgi:DNA-directed RNA polymerase subunit M/transcription elongation factor TFIIS
MDQEKLEAETAFLMTHESCTECLAFVDVAEVIRKKPEAAKLGKATCQSCGHTVDIKKKVLDAKAAASQKPWTDDGKGSEAGTKTSTMPAPAQGQGGGDRWDVGQGDEKKPNYCSACGHDTLRTVHVCERCHATH